VQIGFASAGNTSEHQYKFDGRAFMEADDACQSEQAERLNAIEGKTPNGSISAARPQYGELLCEGREWVWRKWEQKKPFDLKIKLFSKEGEETSLSYSDIMADGRQVDIWCTRKSWTRVHIPARAIALLETS